MLVVLLQSACSIALNIVNHWTVWTGRLLLGVVNLDCNKASLVKRHSVSSLVNHFSTAVFCPGLKKGTVLLGEKGHFCSRNYILRALSHAEVVFEGTLCLIRSPGTMKRHWTEFVTAGLWTEKSSKAVLINAGIGGTLRHQI